MCYLHTFVVSGVFSALVEVLLQQLDFGLWH